MQQPTRTYLPEHCGICSRRLPAGLSELSFKLPGLCFYCPLTLVKRLLEVLGLHMGKKGRRKGWKVQAKVEQLEHCLVQLVRGNVEMFMQSVFTLIRLWYLVVCLEGII